MLYKDNKHFSDNLNECIYYCVYGGGDEHFKSMRYTSIEQDLFWDSQNQVRVYLY